MKYIKPMNYKEFAEHLLTLKTGNTVEFGCSAECDYPNEMPDADDVADWYFARVMEIKEYGSRFILIDYAGGEEAFAIPLNCYTDHCDEDDRHIVPGFVKEYFCKHNRFLNGVDDEVFVEMDDTKLM